MIWYASWKDTHLCGWCCGSNIMGFLRSHICPPLSWAIQGKRVTVLFVRVFGDMRLDLWCCMLVWRAAFALWRIQDIRVSFWVESRNAFSGILFLPFLMTPLSDCSNELWWENTERSAWDFAFEKVFGVILIKYHRLVCLYYLALSFPWFKCYFENYAKFCLCKCFTTVKLFTVNKVWASASLECIKMINKSVKFLCMS